MEDVGIFYGNLVNFPANLWPFGIFCVHLVIFPLFGMLYQKNLATLLQKARVFFQRRRKYFSFKNALGYLLCCKIIECWRFT
jgi:hypothetical protein